MAAPATIVLLYQSLLGIYGDRGNATVLERRLAWRGIDSRLVVVEPGDPVPDDAQVYLLGGGEDSAQITAVRSLTADGGLHRAVERGAAVLAVCAGFQIAGHTFTVGADDTVIEGLGLLDVTTVRGPERAVGEILSRWDDPPANLVTDPATDPLLTGFENHGGWTTLGPAARPLARVQVGIGNDRTGTEGAQQGKVVGTYPHGPVLARNPLLADHLLQLGLDTELDPLPRPEVSELRRQRLAAARR